jgi:hypothetical protein
MGFSSVHLAQDHSGGEREGEVMVGAGDWRRRRRFSPSRAAAAAAKRAWWLFEF